MENGMAILFGGIYRDHIGVADIFVMTEDRVKRTWKVNRN